MVYISDDSDKVLAINPTWVVAVEEVDEHRSRIYLGTGKYTRSYITKGSVSEIVNRLKEV